MMKYPMIGLALIGLAACTPSQLARFDAAEKAAFRDGQLFCAYATPAGPIIAAVANVAGVPVIVTNKAADVVAAACRAVNAAAVPVSPPANASPASTPVIAAPVPAAASAP